ncbi:hypothetical protein EAE93_22450 [Photorhabdus akhurstii]|nr:hypothetical protein [Photorhabdus akhurstii]
MRLPDNYSLIVDYFAIPRLDYLLQIIFVIYVIRITFIIFLLLFSVDICDVNSLFIPMTEYNQRRLIVSE